MGWFAIACVCGFLLYQSWRMRLDQSWRIRLGRVFSTKAGIITTAVVVACSLLAIILLSKEYYTDGLAARLVFGGVLGFGFGYVSAKNGRGPPLIVSQRSTYLSIGMALIILAMVAPHVDTWFSQSWFRKSAQDARWSFCLTAGTLCPANQEQP